MIPFRKTGLSSCMQLSAMLPVSSDGCKRFPARDSFDHVVDRMRESHNTSPTQVSLVSYVFYTLGVLMIAQGLVSLIEGFRYRTYVRRSMCQPLGTFSPRAALIIPCKGVDGGLEANLRAFFSQDYPEYEIIFAIASSDDF